MVGWIVPLWMRPLLRFAWERIVRVWMCPETPCLGATAVSERTSLRVTDSTFVIFLGKIMLKGMESFEGECKVVGHSKRIMLGVVAEVEFFFDGTHGA